ncbi:uncharacterized protein [Littorina saxatilis]|uniref:uncharacterized protein n=1 Tax=Littorina saxatilis TaxID=31220 RepID=UPI0038B4B4D7
MPPKRAASLRVSEVTRAAGGKQSRQRASTAATTSTLLQEAVQPAPDLAMLLAEMRRMGERQEAFQTRAESAILSLQRENAGLRERARQESVAAPTLRHELPQPSRSAVPQETNGRHESPGQSTAAASLIHDLTGEGPKPTVPVDLFVEDKIKQRIWTNEAIDMALLVKGEEGPSYDVTITKSTEGPSLQIRDSPQKASTLSESRWMAAWNIFTAIYVQKFSAAGQGLAVHFQQVQLLMQEKGDWRGYDRSFRRMVQQGLKTWGASCPELYTTARLKFIQSVQNAPLRCDSPADGNRWNAGAPKGYCLNFHVKGSCTLNRCRYKHACFHCQNGEHPAISCPEAKQADQSFRGKPQRGSNISQ